MKVLIWFLCIFANALITTFFRRNGVILGAIPAMVLFWGTMWLAQALCKKWDEHKENIYQERMRNLLEEIKNENEHKK